MATEPFRPARIDDRETWQRIAADPAAAAELTRQRADLDQVPPTMPLPTAADYLAARRSNDRARLDNHWRRTRPQFARLTVDRLLKGIDPNDGDDRLLNWSFAFVHEPTWVVSAHLPQNDLPLSGAGQLDLAGCEAAGELAEFREAMLPWIEVNTQTLGETIVREIDRRVIGPIMTETPPWWARLDARRDDAKRLNNWTGVCAGSILTACQSLEATGHPRPECRDRMIALLRVFFEVAFGEAGECEEGVGYWNYGIEYACLPMMRMTRAQLAESFDIERIKLVANYPEQCHLVGDVFFCGNDGEPRASITPGVDAWLADLTGSDFLRYWGSLGRSGGLRSIPHLLRFLQSPGNATPTTQVAAPRHPPARLLADQQAAIFQRPSTRGLFTFTVTGGTNDELHNHNDLGTFQLFLGDRLIIPDLGRPQYTTDFFKDATRYTKYIVAASSGHCCPAVNGVEQRVGKAAAGRVIGWSPEHGELSLDLTTAYPPDARLKRWHRSTHVPPDSATAIQTDEFELDGDGIVTHRIWSLVEPKAADGGATILLGDDAVLRVEPTPAKAEVLTFRTDDPRLMLRGYAKDSMAYRVDLTYRVEAGKPLTVTTRVEVA